MNIDLLVNFQRDPGLKVAHEIQNFLEKKGVGTRIFNSWALPDAESFADTRFVVSLGGDGTVLAIARKIAGLGIPVFPINMGSFGFITEVGLADWNIDLDLLLEGKIEFCERLLLQCQVLRKGETVFSSLSMNEAVVSGTGMSKLVRFDVSLRSGSLGTYRADGMIIASPTGSTAYSAAAGGPILHPHMKALILSPICPFTLSHRPIVLPSQEKVRLGIFNEQRTGLLLTIDGQVGFDLEPGDEVLVEEAKECIRIAFSRKRNFYDVLRTKLNWSGGPDA